MINVPKSKVVNLTSEQGFYLNGSWIVVRP
jgi:hypothetical protein